MNDKTHSIEIYEPYDHKNDNPILVKAIGIVNGPGLTKYYLLEADLELEDGKISQIIINPRYQGDKIEQLIESQTTVGISHPKPGITLKPEASISYNDIVYWGVGKIQPLKKNNS